MYALKRKLPKKEIEELKEILSLKKEYEIRKRVKVQSDTRERQLFIRIPKEIEKFLKINKGDFIEFNVKIPHPELKQEISYGIRIIKNEK